MYTILYIMFYIFYNIHIIYIYTVYIDLSPHPHRSETFCHGIHLAEAVQAPNVKLGATAGDQPLHLETWLVIGGKP